MVAFAKRYVAGQSDAEDVVVNLLARWLEHPPRVRDGERLNAFLAMSVYHAAVDWMRRERAEQGQTPRRAPQGSIEDGRRAGPLVEAERSMSREAMRSRLAKAVERLSDDDRLLLETHYGHALTVDECVQQMGISRDAFHQRLHRARARLAGLLAVGEEAR
jgi:RNA polymerase sigma factor (sigma-70 family)